MTSSLERAKQALGARLRELRQDAGLTGTELARRCGWHQTKTSKIEYGKTKPTEDDIRLWCVHTHAEAQVSDLIATLRNVEAAWLEWRRLLSAGTKHRQQAAIRLEARSQHIRCFHPVLIPGLLQTADYAEEILRNVVEFQQVPNDVEQGVAKRMQRQQILYQRDHHFHFIISEQALITTVGNNQIMAGQLDRLQAVIGMARVTLGIVPAQAPYRVPISNFTLFDRRLAQVETVSAELTITQPRELTLYGRAFNLLAQQAATGPAARTLINKALRRKAES